MRLANCREKRNEEKFISFFFSSSRKGKSREVVYNFHLADWPAMSSEEGVIVIIFLNFHPFSSSALSRKKRDKYLFFFSFLRFFVWEKARRVFLLFLYTCYVAGEKCVSRFRPLLGTSHTWEFANSVFLPFLSHIFPASHFRCLFFRSGSTVISPSEKKKNSGKNAVRTCFFTRYI